MSVCKTGKIIVAVDSFKGSLTSRQAGEACRDGILSVLPAANVEVISVADGGEGTVDALREAVDGSVVYCRVKDPSGSEAVAEYVVSSDGKTAIMEMAAASGLNLVRQDRRNPLTADSRGTGEMISDALHRGCRRIFIGIGGSATVDGGMGLLSALGAVFYDESGSVITEFGGAMLGKVGSVDIDSISPQVKSADITVICDVDNPLCGPAGAVRMFASQKGATSEMSELMERGMQDYAGVVDGIMGKKISDMPGAGAAGGVGMALGGILGAKMMRGIDVVLDMIDFKSRIADADLIFTGEGRIDRQTLHGKTPAGILRQACEVRNKESRILPVIALGGAVDDDPELLRDFREAGFAGVFCVMQGPVSLSEAMLPENARRNISRTAAEITGLLLSGM